MSRPTLSKTEGPKTMNMASLLAQDDHETAVDNAESHEYFAENDPTLA